MANGHTKIHITVTDKSCLNILTSEWNNYFPIHNVSTWLGKNKRLAILFAPKFKDRNICPLSYQDLFTQIQETMTEPMAYDMVHWRLFYCWYSMSLPYIKLMTHASKTTHSTNKYLSYILH